MKLRAPLRYEVEVAGAFSILKRIVMGETSARRGNEERLPSFQYPQADRDG